MNNVAYLPAAKQEEMARPFDAVEFAMMEQFVISFTARDGDNSVQSSMEQTYRTRIPR